MFVLYETPAGYAIFKLLDEEKIKPSAVDNLFLEFETPERANQVVKLQHFEKFSDTTQALAAATAAVEGKISKPLKKTLKKLVQEDVQSRLLVADAKLGGAIKEKLELKCVSNSAVQELMRCIRSQSESLLAGFPKREMTAMALGLAHSLSRYKLKFSPDKIDTMIVQAQCLLDDLDKELNNYLMRAREWYGWHFPEMGKLVTDNIAYVKLIKKVGIRENMATADLSEILPEDLEERVKEAAEVSMGTEISEEDIMCIQHLCNEVISIDEYRTHLSDYLKARMLAMAPNLTVLVGETVGARLIAHAGSLVNLAKHPASTLQILGAEKALFRALKTKKDTPKYGLIYHAGLVGQASTHNKGKISRSLAAKASLATRVDAFGEDVVYELGIEHRAKLETRLRMLEEGNLRKLSGTGKAKAKLEKYHAKSEIQQYPVAVDNTIPIGKKRKREEGEEGAASTSIVKKEEPEEEAEGATNGEGKKKKKKKNRETLGEDSSAPETKKIKTEEVEAEPETPVSEKKKKKKKRDSEMMIDESIVKQEDESAVAEGSSKKKKKKSLASAADESSLLESSAAVDDSLITKSKKKKKKNKGGDNDD